MAPRRQSSASHSALTSSDAAPLEVDAILAQRATYFRTHPVMINDVRIPTPPIQRTFRIMCQTVLSGLPGCAFVAFPRFGKTRAARYCCEKLMEVFPAVAAVSIHIHHNRYPPPRDFFATLLRQTGFGDTQTASTSQMRDRVVRAWQVLALTRNAPTLVIVGDELQALTPDSFGWLMDITNDLDQRGVRTISLSFAQPDLNARRVVFKESHRGDILGRFMCRVFAFEGINSARELREVMRFYDDPQLYQYPPASGICFTRFFFPQAYERGWRLSACAETCWELLRLQAATRLSSPSTVEKLSVGMQWVTATLHYALTNYSDLAPTIPDRSKTKAPVVVKRLCYKTFPPLERLLRD